MNGQESRSQAVVEQFFGALGMNLKMCGATKNEAKQIMEKVYRQLEDKTYDPQTKAEALLKQHRLVKSIAPDVSTVKLILPS